MHVHELHATLLHPWGRDHERLTFGYVVATSEGRMSQAEWLTRFLPHPFTVSKTMSRVILFNKPFGVLSQFTDAGTKDSVRKTLSEFIDVPHVYATGRLDRDSEGLLVLTDDGRLQHRISDPKHKMKKTYWVQVEGIPTDAAMQQLRTGIQLKDGPTLPAKVCLIDEPAMLWPRDPPVRFRKTVPDCWMEITISQGRNRQVRRMTAAIGFPTLRLIRHKVGKWTIDGIESGGWVDTEA